MYYSVVLIKTYGFKIFFLLFKQTSYLKWHHHHPLQHNTHFFDLSGQTATDHPPIQHSFTNIQSWNHGVPVSGSSSFLDCVVSVDCHKRRDSCSLLLERQLSILYLERWHNSLGKHPYRKATSIDVIHHYVQHTLHNDNEYVKIKWQCIKCVYQKQQASTTLDLEHMISFI